MGQAHGVPGQARSFDRVPAVHTVLESAKPEPIRTATDMMPGEMGRGVGHVEVRG